MITLDRLHRDAGGDRHQQQRQQHQDDGGYFGHHERPVRDRARVEHLVRALVAFAPNQFAGVIYGDDDRDDGKGAVKCLDHDPRHRIDDEIDDAVGVPHGADAVEKAERQQHEKSRALENLRHLEARPLPALHP